MQDAVQFTNAIKKFSEYIFTYFLTIITNRYNQYNKVKQLTNKAYLREEEVNSYIN